MTVQFVDLFDRKRQGVNYWAGIAVSVGLMVAFAFFSVRVLYNGLVVGVPYSSPEGEPWTLGAMILSGLKGRVMEAMGFGLVLVTTATLVRKDIILPFAFGILMVCWSALMRITGFEPGSAFLPGFLWNCFLWSFIMVGALVLLYRLLRNKLIALSIGMASGSLLLSALEAVRSDIPFVWIAQFAVERACMSFIAGVFLFAGIAHHFSSGGTPFSEFGLSPVLEKSGDVPEPDPRLGQTRNPLHTLLLLIFTGGLYIFPWIYKTYSEINRRPGTATPLTAGRALGFLFIPVFNLFWTLWLWIDLPRAIERMEIADPPSGISPDRWVITVCLFAASTTGLVGGFLWRPALFLMAVLLWTGVLSAQSSLNSHWATHRRGS